MAVLCPSAALLLIANHLSRRAQAVTLEVVQTEPNCIRNMGGWLIHGEDTYKLDLQATENIYR